MQIKFLHIFVVLMLILGAIADPLAEINRFRRSRSRSSSSSSSGSSSWFNLRDQPKLDITNYFWLTVYDSCSVTCGLGKQVPKLICFHKNTRSKKHASFCRGLKRPNTFPRTCSAEDLCENPPMWKATQWSQCSQTCGRNGVRHRTLYCQKFDYLDHLQTVSDKECELNAGIVRCGQKVCRTSRPADTEQCNTSACPVNNVNPQNPKCVQDGDFYCLGNTNYCHVKGYRELCCKTCENWRPENAKAALGGDSRLNIDGFQENDDFTEDDEDIDELDYDNLDEDDMDVFNAEWDRMAQQQQHPNERSYINQNTILNDQYLQDSGSGVRSP